MASIAGDSCVTRLGKRKRAAIGGINSIAAVKAEAEEEILNKIVAHLRGSESLQLWVLHMLDKGILQKQASGTAEKTERMVSQSNNKFNLMSHQDWIDVLAVASPDTFPKEITKSGTKWQLQEYGCYMGGIDPSSAIPSRKVSVIGQFLQSRATDVLSGRHSSLTLVTSGPEHKPKLVQHPWCSNGVFQQLVVDEPIAEGGTEKKVYLQHRATGKSVAWPDTVPTSLAIDKNYVESEAVFHCKLADVSLTRCFKEAGVELPQAWWMRRMKETMPAEGESTLATPGAGSRDGQGSSPAVTSQDGVASERSSPAPVVAAPPPGMGGLVLQKTNTSAHFKSSLLCTACIVACGTTRLPGMAFEGKCVEFMAILFKASVSGVMRVFKDACLHFLSLVSKLRTGPCQLLGSRL
eukprot:4635104-Amphidinium_carterae.1